MGADASVIRNAGMDATKNKSKLAEDVKKITTAASKLRIGKSQRRDTVVVPVLPRQPVDTFRSEAATKEQPIATTATTTTVDRSKVHVQADAAPARVNHSVVRASASSTSPSRHSSPEVRRWTLTDLLHCLGAYVQDQCADLHAAPTPSEVAMWVRCADRALQLNGWTVNSFLMESHVVFTYMLLAQAFERFTFKTLVDVKEVVMMCLYVSYTYNANEISYPLRPFLVKQDKAAFWDKCTLLSLGASTQMLRLNMESGYYADVLASLKSTVSV